MWKRNRCVDELFEELNHRVYSDQDSSKVLDLTQKVAGVFARGRRFAETSELEALKQLRADSKVSCQQTAAIHLYLDSS